MYCLIPEESIQLVMRLGWDRQSDSGEAGPSGNLISLAI